MRALVKLAAGPGHLEVREQPTPAPAPGQIVARVTLAGICHTDLSMVEYNASARRAYRPRWPLVLGHEFSGVVAAPDPSGAGPAAGSPIVASAHVTCHECAACRGGRSMLCSRLQVLGLDVDGVFATHACLPVRNVSVLPDDLPPEVAALAEPFAVASHALDAGCPAAGESVAIIGPGAVGLCALAAALSRTPDVTVLGLQSDVMSLTVAREMGAASVGDVALSSTDAAYDLVIETAGHPDAVSAALNVCRPGGRVVCVGLPSEPVPVDTAAMARAEKRIIGVRAYDLGEWAALPGRLAEAAARLRPLLTHVVALDEFDRAVELVRSRQAIKVGIAPGL